MTSFSRQAGFGYIAAILVLATLATLAAALVRTNTAQQAASALDTGAARALMAARAGTEWGLFRVLNNNAGNNCFATQTLNLSSLNGFAVTVSCTQTVFYEGQDANGAAVTKAIYAINAVACNSAACPDTAANAVRSNYVESRRVATACATTAPVSGGACY
ncbi:hypothetical protein [Massilia sp. NR 4-1]|uniref:hypothetical protein n=1 Tax=Massilia sp. NR 4-1 TaxID=1678028 RepID=UPI00067DF65C|nr:hypothetical protein [Massilia sp. NR 4-1]AKU21358.1 hypothetical protein ACZ75_07560 [Massilia sp. NR 4-1]